MYYYINNLSDIFTCLTANLKTTKQLISTIDIWLMSSRFNEVPLVDQPTIINGIKQIVQHGRTYTNDVDVIIETLKFIVKWSNV